MRRPSRFSFWAADFYDVYSSAENIIKAHQVEGMFYADDSQLYITFEAANKSVNLAKLEDCVKDIKAWTIGNKLSLNDDKTEVLHICSRYAETDVVGGIRFGTTDVSIAPEAKNLGVVVDKNLSLSSHVNQICKKACLAIRKIGRIRKYLNKESAEKLVHAFVSSQLDCGNSVLFGLPEFQLAKLQHLQNTAARLVTLTKRQEHISPILHDLHWLPVKSRILYKILLITFKALHGLAPSYIRELVVTKDPVHSLRSNAAPQLHCQSVYILLLMDNTLSHTPLLNFGIDFHHISGMLHHLLTLRNNSKRTSLSLNKLGVLNCINALHHHDVLSILLCAMSFAVSAICMTLQLLPSNVSQCPATDSHKH